MRANALLEIETVGAVCVAASDIKFSRYFSKLEISQLLLNR
jgi:hypothetical protein